MKKVAIFRVELLRLSETFIYEQAQALRDWQPTLIGFRDLGEKGLKTHGVGRALIPRPNRLLETLLFWFALPIPSAVKKFKSLGVDLVHAHFGIDATEIWPSVKATGLPMVVTLHGYDINIRREWWESGRDGLRRRVYPRRLLKMARDPKVTFIAVSRAIKDRAVTYGIPVEKISVAYIGVDTDRFKPGKIPLDRRKKRILFVGRMVPKKAPLLLIDAFAEVGAQIHDAELVMIGDGPLLAEAKRRASELGVKVEFLGAQSADSVLAQMHQARVFCLPSVVAENGDAEGLPISIIEAQACGVPAVVTSHSGNEESIIPGVSGFLVKEHDVKGLSQKIIKILSDEMFSESASEMAVFLVKEKFELVSNCLKLGRIYEGGDT